MERKNICLYVQLKAVVESRCEYNQSFHRNLGSEIASFSSPFLTYYVCKVAFKSTVSRLPVSKHIVMYCLSRFTKVLKLISLGNLILEQTNFAGIFLTSSFLLKESYVRFGNDYVCHIFHSFLC